MPEDKNNTPESPETPETPTLEETLRETQRLLQTLVDENKALRTELQGVKDANLRLAKSMPAKPKQTFESAIADMFDLRKEVKK